MRAVNLIPFPYFNQMAERRLKNLHCNFPIPSVTACTIYAYIKTSIWSYRLEEAFESWSQRRYHGPVSNPDLVFFNEVRMSLCSIAWNNWVFGQCTLTRQGRSILGTGPGIFTVGLDISRVIKGHKSVWDRIFVLAMLPTVSPKAFGRGEPGHPWTLSHYASSCFNEWWPFHAQAAQELPRPSLCSDAAWCLLLLQRQLGKDGAWYSPVEWGNAGKQLQPFSFQHSSATLVRGRLCKPLNPPHVDGLHLVAQGASPYSRFPDSSRFDIRWDQVKQSRILRASKCIKVRFTELLGAKCGSVPSTQRPARVRGPDEGGICWWARLANWDGFRHVGWFGVILAQNSIPANSSADLLMPAPFWKTPHVHRHVNISYQFWDLAGF